MNFSNSIIFAENFTKKPVLCYDSITNELIGEYDSITKASRTHGIKTQNISRSYKAKKPIGCTSKKLNKKIYFKLKTN